MNPCRKGLFEDYDGFVEKFKPKKTTDDCYTPPKVFEAIQNWACERYGIQPEQIVRPFFPGGDYENFEYPDDCVVLDNPPFSILSKICWFYMSNGIRFFLFAPNLTVFSASKAEYTAIICDAEIVYQNGARVDTAFVTNMEGDIAAMTAPTLKRAINEAQKSDKPEKPVLGFPWNFVTSTRLGAISNAGVDIRIHRDECVFVRKADGYKKGIFGAALFVGTEIAEKMQNTNKIQEAKKIIIPLSDVEKLAVIHLDKKAKKKKSSDGPCFSS